MRFGAAGEGRTRHERPDFRGILWWYPWTDSRRLERARIQLVLSASVLAEYREVGAEIEAKYGGQDFEAFVTLLAVNSELIDAPEYLDPHVCSDTDDDKFLACATAGAAQVIISGDAALRATSGWRGIEVLTPRQFVDKHLTASG